MEGTWVATTHTYDSLGNRVSTTDPKNNVAQFFYQDATHAMPTSIVGDPLNGTGQQTTSTESSVISGDRKGTNWGNGGGWHDNTANSYPDWIQASFDGSKTINEIDVFTLQDNYTSPAEPTEAMTFSQYGILDFKVQYWNGSAWDATAV